MLVGTAAPVRVDAPVTLAQTGFVQPAARVAITPEVARRVARIGEDFALGARLASRLMEVGAPRGI